MADAYVTTTAPKKRGRPPKKQVEKVVSETNKKEPTNEFNSYVYTTTLTSNSMGFNLFDYYTPEQIKELVKDPIANNEMLRRISLMLYGLNGTYTNTVDYMTSLCTLDSVIVPYGKNKQKKEKNKRLMESTLRTIKHKEFVRDALFRGMIEGIAFYYFETTTMPVNRSKFMTDYDVNTIGEINEVNEISELGINAAIISLPTDWTQIIGLKNSNYVIAFNLDYFDLSDGENVENKLKRFPKEIRDAYHKKHDGITSGNWVILDSNRTIVHKIRSLRTEIWGRPLVLAAINEIMYGDYFLDTKRGVLDEVNNKIVYQTFPEGKDKGVSALTAKQQQSQHEKVKSAVVSKNSRNGLSFFSVSAGTKIDCIETSNTDILEDTYESDIDDRIARALGIAGSLLDGSNSGSYSAQENNLELLTSEVLQWVGQIQNELNKCISNCIIKDDKNRVECEFLPMTHVNKGKMVGYAQDMYLQGKGSLTLWVSACGISPNVFYALLDEELENSVETKYPVHATSYTKSADDTNNEGGRPETDNPTDSTIQTRANNGNALPTPSDTK